MFNLRSALKVSISLETLRKEREEAYEAFMREADLVDEARKNLEAAERKARLARRRWLDLGTKVHKLESVGSGNSR